MARTKRRKTGNRHWLRKDYDGRWVSQIYGLYNADKLSEEEMDEAMQLHAEDIEESRLFWEYDHKDYPVQTIVKYWSNRTFRQNERKQLHKAMKMLDLESYDYNTSPELQTRRYWWFYD